MQVNILGFSAVAFFLFFSTAFLLILFVKTESQQS
uniref:Photosystem II reaction center protein M n=1 Tax=Pseudocodium devriesii TaxID=453070 RepID=A0A386B157_9CHLO|nr:photosystem II protein M [Pseudocodium devriesii]AYC65429.1 photosystem II protein M [Pseudocodium devriesii]